MFQRFEAAALLYRPHLAIPEDAGRVGERLVRIGLGFAGVAFPAQILWAAVRVKDDGDKGLPDAAGDASSIVLPAVLGKLRRISGGVGRLVYVPPPPPGAAPSDTAARRPRTCGGIGFCPTAPRWRAARTS